MNIDQAFPSSYLKSADIDKPLQKQIKSVAVEEVGQGEDAEQKPILYFADDTRMVLNKTNANCIKEMFGPETDKWTGKTVVLEVKKVQFGANLVPAIRVKYNDPADDGDVPF